MVKMNENKGNGSDNQCNLECKGNVQHGKTFHDFNLAKVIIISGKVVLVKPVSHASV